MRMVHAIQENHTEGAQTVKQTGVGGDAKIVYALLTGMVSDKVVYPVRETATNAWEVSPAGKPAEIELPTRFNPQFTIRDFGPGLPHRFMMERYPKIGDSTKDGDDNAVGGWGFGSKSPLAYLMRSDCAGSFTVISRYRGYRRTYIIGLGNNGKIQSQFMGEWPLEPEDRGTGLEVTFPVRPEDIQRFHDHAKAVYWSFEPRPRLSPAIDFGTPRVLHSGDGWTVYRAESVPFHGPQVKLGPVMYPINFDLVPYGASKLIEEDTCIVFEAKIGSLSVNTSREALQYDDRTEAGLRVLFQHYDADWMTKAQAAVDAEPTYFDARRRAWIIGDSLGRNGWGIVEKIGWRGFPFHADLFPEGGKAKAACWPEVDGWRRKLPHAASTPVVFKADWKVNPGELQDRKVVIQHATNRSLERLEAAGLMDTPVLWVRVKRPDLDWALERMGRPEYIVLDDIKLPKIPAGKREKRPENIKRRRFLEDNGLRTFTKLADLDEELIYVSCEGRGRNREILTEVDGTRRFFRPNTYLSILSGCRTHGLIDDLDVLVLNEDEKPRGHWINLGDYLSELIDAAIDPSQVAPVIPWGESSFPDLLRKIQRKSIDIGAAPQELRDIYYEMLAMLKTRTTLEREETVHDKLAALNLKITGTDIKSVAKNPTQPVNDRWNALVAKMPLLPMLLNGMASYYHSSVTEDEQRRLDHYFALIAK